MPAVFIIIYIKLIVKYFGFAQKLFQVSKKTSSL